MARLFILLLILLNILLGISPSYADMLGSLFEQKSTCDVRKDIALQVTVLNEYASVGVDGVKYYHAELDANILGGSLACEDVYDGSSRKRILSVHWESGHGKLSNTTPPDNPIDFGRVTWTAPSGSSQTSVRAIGMDGFGSVAETTIILTPRSILTEEVNILISGTKEIGNSLLFSASTSYATEYDFNWYFSDGTTAKGRSVHHAFTDPGSYNVTVEATTRDTNRTIRNSDSIEIHAQGDPGKLSMSLSSMEVMEGGKTNLTLTFSDMATSDRVVTLSSDSSQVTVPESVTVKAGESSSAPVEVAVGNDDIQTGHTVVRIRGSSSYLNATARTSLTVLDDEVGTDSSLGEIGLSLTGHHIVEGYSTVELIPFFKETSDKPRTINITSSLSGLLWGRSFLFPLSVTVPAGANRPSSPISIRYPGNQVFDADMRVAVLTASSSHATNTASVNLRVEEIGEYSSGFAYNNAGPQHVKMDTSQSLTRHEIEILARNDTSQRQSVKFVVERQEGQHNLLFDQEKYCWATLDPGRTEGCALELRFDEDAEPGTHAIYIKGVTGDGQVLFQAYEPFTVTNENIRDIRVFKGNVKDFTYDVGSSVIYKFSVLGGGDGPKPTSVEYKVWAENTETKTRWLVESGYADTSDGYYYVEGWEEALKEGSYVFWIEALPAKDADFTNNTTENNYLNVIVEDRSRDTDGDGVADFYDNCISQPNGSQSDKDADGVGDECDSWDNTFDTGRHDLELVSIVTAPPVETVYIGEVVDYRITIKSHSVDDTRVTVVLIRAPQTAELVYEESTLGQCCNLSVCPIKGPVPDPADPPPPPPPELLGEQGSSTLPESTTPLQRWWCWLGFNVPAHETGYIDVRIKIPDIETMVVESELSHFGEADDNPDNDTSSLTMEVSTRDSSGSCPSGGDICDLDNDGMDDLWEKRYGLNPNLATDAELDPDLDGFSNLEEYHLKTDPTDPNSPDRDEKNNDDRPPDSEQKAVNIVLMLMQLLFDD